MNKKYHIEGFDCPSCASKCEKHLSKHEKIENCSISFETSVLSIEYKEDELTIQEIKDIIGEVEDDDILISDINNREKSKKNVVFDKENVITFIKIVVSLALALVAIFVFKDESRLHYWMRFSFFLVAYLLCAYELLIDIVKTIIHKENPLNEDLLMIIAASGAFVLASLKTNDYLDGLVVLMLFMVGETIESITSNKSKDAVINAIDLRSDKANLLVDDDVIVVSPEDVHVGDKLVIKLGEKIPCDGVVISGDGYIDTSSLNGELLPKAVLVNDEVYSGCTLTSGSLVVEVRKEYSDSTASKLIDLITESENKKSKTDLFINKFAKIYTPMVVVLAVLFIVIASLITGDWSTYIYRGLEFLVASCPCALVISIPLAYFASIGKASRNGIVIKGSAYIDNLAGIKVLATDKTGTLTTGEFEIKEVNSVNFDEKELLNIISSIEACSNHPLARAINNAVKPSKKVSSFTEIMGEGIIGEINNKKYCVGSDKLLERFSIKFKEVERVGTVIYLASEKEYLGYIVLNDKIKENSKRFVNELRNRKVKTVLLTGDQKEKALEVAGELNIDECHFALRPEEKMSLLEALIKDNNNHVVYLGDGINDAPSLKLADVGIAMGGVGSDSAVEASDVIIMDDDPLKVIKAINISKKGRATAIFNIAFAISIKLLVIILSMFGLIPMWVAVIADTGLTVLLSLNSLRLLINRKKK